MPVKTLTSDEVKRVLNERDHLAVVHCFTSNSDEKPIKAIMTQWASKYPEAAFYTLNLAESQDIVKSLDIEDSDSRFLVLRDGKKIGSVHCAKVAEEGQINLAEGEVRWLLGREEE
ncbi:hypothetical protein QBC34DRAFT_383057 [Podospora aff. communis PSN243]|uniref:Thioredoxin domain-containing protein n=1 Tax=Podospora aff. communis PSN243 TaxID=3040156 RepID=A0AAV9GCY3_9PEZI|nr:hypothetical protein QBC34DRAFT_383057 [Podospora aff. communis PSN243]